MSHFHPIFVVGNPRSGTTLLRLILTSHPEIVIPPEGGFMCWLYGRFGAWTAREWASPEKAGEFVLAVADSKKFKTWGIEPGEIAVAIAKAKPASYSEACETIYLVYREKHKPLASRWGDKNNFYTAHVGLLARMFPSACFVHIVRDVRDVMCSYRDMAQFAGGSAYAPNLPVGAEAVAREWLKNVNAVVSEFEKIPERSSTIRYEDLVGSPVSELERLCGRLNLSYSGDMLNFHALNREGKLEPEETLAWKKRTLEPVTLSQIGRYQREATPEDQAAIRGVAAATMDRFGYPCGPASNRN